MIITTIIIIIISIISITVLQSSNQHYHPHFHHHHHHHKYHLCNHHQHYHHQSSLSSIHNHRYNWNLTLIIKRLGIPIQHTSKMIGPVRYVDLLIGAPCCPRPPPHGPLLTVLSPLQQSTQLLNKFIAWQIWLKFCKWAERLKIGHVILPCLCHWGGRSMIQHQAQTLSDDIGISAHLEGGAIPCLLWANFSSIIGKLNHSLAASHAFHHGMCQIAFTIYSFHEDRGNPSEFPQLSRVIPDFFGYCLQFLMFWATFREHQELLSVNTTTYFTKMCDHSCSLLSLHDEVCRKAAF